MTVRKKSLSPAASHLKPANRCAIYTRKSCEEGLELEFNSLHAQRESAEAFIASQQHEGWECLPDRYDDGGFSGGSLERPALNRLLEDIKTGRIDCVGATITGGLMVTVKRKLNVSIASRGRIAIRPFDPNAEPPRPRPTNRTPRIAKLMALAIRFDEMLRTGEASDTIDLARRGHVTQPRMSQIMALNQLAPDIQEALLNLPATKGKPEIHEKRLRPIAAMLSWDEQRVAWRELSATVTPNANGEATPFQAVNGI
jgi:hypothetical protein